LIIFGTNVTEKVGNHNVLYFPPHLTSASALPRETGNPLKLWMLVTKNTRNTLKYNLITPEPPLVVKWSTVCNRQDQGSEHSILQCVTLTLDVYQVCHCVGHRVKNVSCSYQA